MIQNCRVLYCTLVLLLNTFFSLSQLSETCESGLASVIIPEVELIIPEASQPIAKPGVYEVLPNNNNEPLVDLTDEELRIIEANRRKNVFVVTIINGQGIRIYPLVD